jgi:ASC-1-like (ASCH) protein
MDGTMATYDAPLYEDAFIEMESGRKTVYAVLASDDYAAISSGDRLEFGSFGSIMVGMVRRYPNLEALAEAEGFRNLLPAAETAEEAIRVLRALDEWDPEIEEKRGVLALRVREARRK